MGVLIVPSFLLYATGGLAYGGARSDTTTVQSIDDPPLSTLMTSGSFSKTCVGYAVGAGGEWMLSSNWSAKLEYLHYDLGSATYATGGLANDVGPTSLQGVDTAAVATSSKVRFNDDIVRVGPYGDRYDGRDDYLAFIADTMPKLKGYAMKVHRVTFANNGLAFVELSETVELEGKPKFLVCLSPVPIIIDLDQSQGSVGFRRRFILFKRRLRQFPGFGKSYIWSQFTKQTIEEVDARQARISRRIFRVQGDSAFELLLVIL
jgi:hypothetical protein